MVRRNGLVSLMRRSGESTIEKKGRANGGKGSSWGRIKEKEGKEFSYFSRVK